MDLAVDDAREDDQVAEIVDIFRRWGGAAAEMGDLAIAHGGIAAFDDAVFTDEAALDHAIEVTHGLFFQAAPWRRHQRSR